jgi:hypothetical protein
MLSISPLAGRCTDFDAPSVVEWFERNYPDPPSNAW